MTPDEEWDARMIGRAAAIITMLVDSPEEIFDGIKAGRRWLADFGAHMTDQRSVKS